MGIYVWGTGCGASELVEQGLEPEKITAFVDSFPSGERFLGRPVLLPRQLEAEDCDLLIITTRHAEAVEKSCEELGIPREKLLFLKNNYRLEDKNYRCQSKTLLDEKLLSGLLPRQHIVPAPAQLAEPKLPLRELSNDYVRLSTLELLCRRLEAVPGAAAELGVYRGFFARCIQLLLPERKLYLFDSFEGFLPEDCAGEAFQAAHRNTAVEKVLAVMPYPECVTVKPGFFPGSLEGLEERFCLVSLDVDFEATTLEGLRYFWPRLNPGGYLLLHDWGSPRLPGVARAVRRYEAETGQRLPSVPIPDLGGTLVLCKM